MLQIKENFILSTVQIKYLLRKTDFNDREKV